MGIDPQLHRICQHTVFVWRYRIIYVILFVNNPTTTIVCLNMMGQLPNPLAVSPYSYDRQAMVDTYVDT